jgi:hypothetical protein
LRGFRAGRDENLYIWLKLEQFAVLICGKPGYNLAERASERVTKILMATACKHPKVRIVSRHEDTEYVECLECGEVFDAEEFRDMEIEETAETEDVSDDG